MLGQPPHPTKNLYLNRKVKYLIPREQFFIVFFLGGEGGA